MSFLIDHFFEIIQFSLKLLKSLKKNDLVKINDKSDEAHGFVLFLIE
jgi:hypothetical protein